MSFHHQRFTCLVFLFLALFTPSFPLSFVFNDFKNLNSDNLTVNGVAEITSSGILRLTNDTPRLIGHGLYPYPIPFKNPTTKKPLSFSTSFVFAMVPEYKRLGGHGLAFTIFSENGLAGAQPNQYLGLLNVSDNGKASNHLFAIELDTVKDFEFNDINDNHVGININSMVSKNSTKAGFYVDGNSTKQDLNLNGGKKIQAWVDYDALKPELNVTLSPFSEKPDKPILSVAVDLSLILQDSMYVGFSASTGKLASSHYIFGWSFMLKEIKEQLACTWKTNQYSSTFHLLYNQLKILNFYHVIFQPLQQAIPAIPTFTLSVFKSNNSCINGNSMYCIK